MRPASKTKKKKKMLRIVNDEKSSDKKRIKSERGAHHPRNRNSHTFRKCLCTHATMRLKLQKKNGKKKSKKPRKQTKIVFELHCALHICLFRSQHLQLNSMETHGHSSHIPCIERTQPIEM